MEMRTVPRRSATAQSADNASARPLTWSHQDFPVDRISPEGHRHSQRGASLTFSISVHNFTRIFAIFTYDKGQMPY
ncbi:hypothetical protein EAM01S_15_00610 [Erwinia amylovora NBRC 12687 = CFBP 1232]|nr:hypothetical protein EAM01S_15_00610 [Erwinia amylovora NBRC 12687 = CFBP 1232]